MPLETVDKIWMDELVDWDQANIHILTHTLHYGCGVFEGIRRDQPVRACSASPTTWCASRTVPRSS